MMKRCYKDEDVGRGFCVVLEEKERRRVTCGLMFSLSGQRVGTRAPDISDLEFSIRCDRELLDSESARRAPMISLMPSCFMPRPQRSTPRSTRFRLCGNSVQEQEAVFILELFLLEL